MKHEIEQLFLDTGKGGEETGGEDLEAEKRLEKEPRKVKEWGLWPVTLSSSSSSSLDDREGARNFGRSASASPQTRIPMNNSDNTNEETTFEISKKEYSRKGRRPRFSSAPSELTNPKPTVVVNEESSNGTYLALKMMRSGLLEVVIFTYLHFFLQKVEVLPHSLEPSLPFEEYLWLEPDTLVVQGMFYVLLC
jgi:hypothetical protein